MCLYSSVTRAWVRVFIEVFRFAIERFIYCNMGARRHVRKTRLGALACDNTCASVTVVSRGQLLDNKANGASGSV